MSFVLICIVCYVGALTFLNILQFETMEVSESYRKIYWDE